MRRWLPFGVAALALAGLVALSGPAAVEPGAVEPTPDGVRVERLPPPAVTEEVAVKDAAPPSLPRPGDRAMTRLERGEAELEGRLAGWVEAGQLSEVEAAELERISRANLADAKQLVGRVQRGEIHWLGAAVRGIPLRIRHGSQVVNVVGLERARELGAELRAERRARWEVGRR